MADLDDIKSLKLRQLFRYWEGLRGTRKFPLKNEIDPVAIGADMLPFVMLVEARDQGHDFYYRLVGTGIVLAADVEFTGKTVLSYFGEHEGLNTLKGYREVYQTAEPSVNFGDFRDANRQFFTYERLILPFSFDGDKTDIFLVGFDPHLDGYATHFSSGFSSLRSSGN